MRLWFVSACLAVLAAASTAQAQECDRNDDKSRKLLQVAQRAWIAFRDAECAYTTAGSEGGSIHPMEVSQCLTDLTEQRTKQLTSSANCQEGDASCASSDEDGDLNDELQ